MRSAGLGARSGYREPASRIKHERGGCESARCACAGCRSKTDDRHSSLGPIPDPVLNRSAVERRVDEALAPGPAVVDLWPGAVGSDGGKSGIQLGYELRALAFGYADRKRRLVEHVARFGHLARIKPGGDATAGVKIQRCGVSLPSNNTGETFLVISRDNELHSRRGFLNQSSEQPRPWGDDDLSG